LGCFILESIQKFDIRLCIMYTFVVPAARSHLVLFLNYHSLQKAIDLVLMFMCADVYSTKPMYDFYDNLIII
jgi:hypothetical protein